MANAKFAYAMNRILDYVRANPGVSLDKFSKQDQKIITYLENRSRLYTVKSRMGWKVFIND